jgi:predicted DNA-binding transcriptional regulator YafY
MSDRPTLIRHLKLLRQLAASRQGCCVRDLALEYEVSERSIRRDLDSLEVAGFELCSVFREDG